MPRDVFIDESSQTKHRYLLLGGLLTRVSEASLDETFQVARGEDLPRGELGWVKVSRSKLDAYKRFVEVFFSGTFAKDLDFHSIIVDTLQLDDAAYNGGSRAAGFDKEVFQLMKKFGRLYRADNFHFYLDQRDSPNSLTELRNIANRGMMQLSPKRDWPVRRLHYRDSAGCQTMQLVDLLLGAVAFTVNGHRQKPDASPAKCELSDYVLSRAGIVDPRRDTAVAGKFTVWHRQLRPVLSRKVVRLP